MKLFMDYLILMMKAIQFFQTSLSVLKSPQSNCTEDLTIQQQCCETMKPRNLVFVFK